MLHKIGACIHGQKADHKKNFQQQDEDCTQKDELKSGLKPNNK